MFLFFLNKQKFICLVIYHKHFVCKPLCLHWKLVHYIQSSSCAWSKLWFGCCNPFLQSYKHIQQIVDYCYRPPTKLWEGNVFTGFCHSVPILSLCDYYPWCMGTYPSSPPIPNMGPTPCPLTSGIHHIHHWRPLQNCSLEDRTPSPHCYWRLVVATKSRQNAWNAVFLVTRNWHTPWCILIPMWLFCFIIVGVLKLCKIFSLKVQVGNG